MQTPREIWGGLGNQMFQFAYIYAQNKKGITPDTYLQDPKYFQDFIGELKQLYGKGITRIDKIALHLRRGDYVNNPFYVDLTTTEYYDKAILMFPKDKFLVFCADRQPKSDDVSDREWCKQYLDSKGVDYEFFDGKNEIEDMNAMASCKGHIMANSSFSYWSALINKNPDKKIIAPKNYYSDGVERTVYPKDEGWIII